MRNAVPALFALLAMLVGCARYEYDVVSPPQAAGHAGTRGDHRFALDPLEYRLRTVDNRLVMRVYNPTDADVTLLGQQSTVVDPDGQSHPLATQTIAPGGSFIKLIIPPPRPRLYGGGPTFGIGVGGTIGHYPHHHHHHDKHGATYHDHFDGYDYGPRYMTVYDDGNTYFWDWKGEGEVRLNLVYARGRPDAERPTDSFAHGLTIHRVRAK